MRHTIWRLIGCILPLLLIFLLPLFGVSGGVVLVVFIVLMFGCHLLMMRGHGHGATDEHTQRTKGDHHAHSQH